MLLWYSLYYVHVCWTVSLATDCIVATPGRLKDMINEGSCDLSKVQYLVLDEADRM